MSRGSLTVHQNSTPLKSVSVVGGGILYCWFPGFLRNFLEEGRGVGGPVISPI